jgi:PKD repeat protein
MSYNFMQGKSIVNNSLKAILCILLLFVVVQGVQAAGITANFSANITTGAIPLTVAFADKSTGSPTGWAWFFGDETFTVPWTQVNASASWSARSGHTSVTMPDGSIVLMGGDDAEEWFHLVNDVWRSTDKGKTWTLMNESPGWTGRDRHSSVVMPDGSIVLMGGNDDYDYTHSRNDVWRSTNYGKTWVQMTANAEWTARGGHCSVAIPDRSIVLIGGNAGSYMNDTWRSWDKGSTWTQMTTHAEWTARTGHSCVLMPDRSIVLMGGTDDVSRKNDTWRSTDKGKTWTLMNASSGWSARNGHTSVAMPDGSIVLMGGIDINGGYLNDMWRSTDNGATWKQLTNGYLTTAPWTARYRHSSVAMPDGSIILMGGYDDNPWYIPRIDDVWRFMPAGSSARNPSHTYTKRGTYSVTLQAYNAAGYKSTRKVGYITVFVRPTVISILPARGPTSGGTLVNITGTGFTGATAVKFGTTPGTSKTVVSSTKITVRSPAHTAGTVDIRVTTPGGTSAIVAEDKFTYGAPPKVTKILPTSGSHVGNTLVNITGTGFTRATAVKFGTTFGTSKTVVSSTKITVRSPAHAVGIVDVRVTTPYGTSAIVTGDKFTYA